MRWTCSPSPRRQGSASTRPGARDGGRGGRKAMSRVGAARGEATGEFAIAAIVLLVLLLGLIDLGRVFYFAVGFRGAPREGARQGSWFDPATGSNPALSDSAIKGSVDAILRKSGLSTS